MKQSIIISVFVAIIICIGGCKSKCLHQVTLDFTFGKEIPYILIPVTIRDSTKIFIFDTGAEGSHIADTSNLRLDINPKDSAEIIFVHKNATYFSKRTYPEKTFLGKLSIPKKIKFCLPASGNELNVLGSDIIHQLFWRFNFDSMKLTVSDGPLKIDNISEWIKIPYIIKGKSMYVNVVINDTIDMGYYCFDTGYYKELAEEKFPIILYHLIRNSNESIKIGPKINKTGFRKVLTTKDGLQKNYGGYCFVYDSIALFGHKSYNSMVLMLRSDYKKELGDNYLLLSYVTQFHEMYLDTRKKIIYLKP